VDNEGNIIESSVVVETSVKSSSDPEQPSVTLEQLLEQYTAEQILQANSGTIPGTSQELEQVTNYLIKETQENGY
jgi:hypothetical protein